MDTRSTILDAAERVFSGYGFAGATMRRIANAAEVSQALLHYHFRTKAELYNAVFERRSSANNAYREERIDELFVRETPPNLEELVEVLFSPSWTWLGSEQTGSFFAPMVSAISIGEDEQSKELMRRFYDPIARRFIEALKQVLPEISHENAVLAYMFALGARMQINARNGRIDRLCDPDATIDRDEIFDRVVSFVVAGIRDLAEQDKNTPPQGSRTKRKLQPAQ